MAVKREGVGEREEVTYMAVGTAPAALNATVQGFRPRRNAAVAAGARIQELAQMDDED